MNTQRTKVTESKIRQLCSLGLDSHQVIPVLMRMMHDYLPTHSNVFAWVDGTRELDHIYSEDSKFYDVLPLYFEQQKRGYLDGIFDGWAKSIKFRNTLSLDDLLKVGRSEFKKSSLYNEVFRPAGVLTSLCRTVRCGEEPEGTFLLYRAENDPEFKKEDFYKVDRIAKILEYSLSVGRARRAAECVSHSSNTEFVSVQPDGQIDSYTNGAKRLLIMFHEGLGPQRSVMDASGKKTAVTSLLTVNLLKMHDGNKANPPTFHTRNKWGRFQATAFFMCPADAETTNPHITIQLEHFLPPPLAIIEKMDACDLTERQKEICLQIALNCSYEQIADRLDISINTVITHKKEIFSRLAIGSRHHLIDRILYSD